MKNAKKSVININKPINSHFSQFEKSINKDIGFFIKSTLLFMLFFSLNCQLRAQTGGGNSSGQQNFPAGFIPEVSYRKVTNEIFNIPAELDLFTDFTAIDYPTLEPNFSDEKIFLGKGSDGKRAMVIKYLAPEKQFPPQILALKQTNMVNGVFENITLEGIVIANTFEEYHINDEDENIEVQESELPRPSILQDGREKYDFDSIVIIIDKVNRSNFTTYYNDRGEWVHQYFTQYDSRDQGRKIPLLEIEVSKHFSPSGKCVLKITDSQYSEYKKHNQNQQYRKADSSEGYNYADLMKILPNPATDEIFIHLNDKEFDSQNIEIFSMEGKRMYEGFLNGNWIKLDISNYPAGLYFARIIKDGKLFTEKFVKQ